MTMTFLSGGYSVKYIPIEYGKRAGESKFHPIKDTRRYGVQVVRMVLSYNPLRLFLPTGFALLAIGVGKLIYDLNEYDFHVTRRDAACCCSRRSRSSRSVCSPTSSSACRATATRCRSPTDESAGAA